MATIKKKNKTVKKETSPFSIYWEKGNYLLLAAGIAAIIIGFYLMSVGQWDSFESLYISPIILGLAFFIILPASIFYRKKEKTE